MATFKSFEDIQVWQKARTLCSHINNLITTTELAKDYKLKDQINGSSGSIIEISHGSACECQSQLYRILDRQYINKETFDQLYLLCNEIRKMIIGLIHYIQKATIKGPKFKHRQQTN